MIFRDLKKTHYTTLLQVQYVTVNEFQRVNGKGATVS